MVALLKLLRQADPSFRYELADLRIARPVQSRSLLTRAVSQAIEDVTGRPAVLIARPGTHGQKHVMRVASVEQCIAYGPDRLGQAHQSDQHCRIDELVAACQVMALATIRLLGAAD